jgi:hypothetical protein
MAKRPEQNLDVLGQSLLSQQSKRREKADKRRRKDQKKLMILGTLVAGQSLVNNALKRRTKEIADLGTMSKLKSKMQAENLSFYSPIFQSMEGENRDTFENWNNDMTKNPQEYRSLQNHLSPLIMALAKPQIGTVDNKVQFDREYNYIKDDITNDLVQRAYSVDPESGKTIKELFSLGATEFANVSQRDPINKFDLLTNTTENSLEAYKARELTALQSNLDSSIFSRSAARKALNFATLGYVKEDQGKTNPFKRVSSRQTLIPENLQQVLDTYNVNQIVKERFNSRYAVMKNEVEAYNNNEAANDSMEEVWKNMPDRINRGTWFDVHRLPGTVKRKGSGHRLSAHAEDMIDNVYRYVNERLSVKSDLLTQAGTLANMLGDINRPQMKEDVMDIWINLPHIQEQGIQKGDNEYREVLGSLDTLIGRQEFALDFTTALSIRNEKILGFEVDFSEIKSITGQKFEIVQDKDSSIKGPVFGKEGNLKFQTTEIYNSMNMEDKLQSYKTYARAIIENQTRSNNNPAQLRDVAMKFMNDVPHPLGEKPEDFLNNLLGPETISQEFDIPFGMSGSVSPMSSYRPILASPETTVPEAETTVPEGNTMEPLAVGQNVTWEAIDQIVNIRGGNAENNRQFFREVAVAESNNGLNKKTFTNESGAVGIFQIIESQSLNELKRRILEDKRPNLIAHNNILKEKFEIDLTTITKEDLKIPLVNTAVMSAYFMIAPEAIPTDPLKKAIYYVDNYVQYEPKSPTYESDRNKSIGNFLRNNKYLKELANYNTRGADFNYKSFSR